MHAIAKAPSLSFGIEEEFHLVDVKTRELAVAPKQLLSQLQKNIGSHWARAIPGRDSD
jgi:gamma-glutamyl:cysteine ligase YbdK (ATP-grasp superfamily)